MGATRGTKAGALLLILPTVLGQQNTFVADMKLTRGITPACAAALAKVNPTTDHAKAMEIFSGRVKQALTVVVPEMVTDIRGGHDEAAGIGKFLFRPQAWSRGAPDSCLYLEETKFCNIDLLRRTSSWGVCIPDACTAADVRRTLLPSPLFDELSKQTDIICVTNEDARATTGLAAYGALGVTVALLLVTLTAAWMLGGGNEPSSPGLLRSLYGARESINTAFSSPSAVEFYQKLLKCFSLKESWAVLTAPPRQSPFLCLEAVRVLSFLWIILGHVLYFTGLAVNWTNQRDALGFYGRGFLGTLPGLIASGFYFAVDTFLFISAFLAIISVLKQLNEKKVPTMSFIKDIPKSYLKRYLRLTPAYAMAIYIFTYVAPIMVEGVRRPMFMAFCENCKHRAWENMLYINNIVSDQPEPMCYPVSWFLGLLFQFQLLGPWVGLLAAKSPRLTVVALLCLCTASYMLSAYLTETREFRLNPMDTINGYNRWANEWYTKPWTRAPSYLIGCIYAIMWYQYDKTIKAKLDKSVLLRVSLLLMSFLLFGLTIFGAKGERPNVPAPWSLLERQLYITLSASGWTIGFALLATLLFTGSTWGLRELLEHPTWSFYGRLAYAMYLLHAAVLGIVTGSQGEPWHFTKFLLLTLFVGVTGVTFLGSLPLYLLVERPFTALSDLLLADKPKSVEGGREKKGKKAEQLPLDPISPNSLEASQVPATTTR